MSVDRMPIPAPEEVKPSWLLIAILTVVIFPAGGIIALFFRLRKVLKNHRLASYRNCLRNIGDLEAVPLYPLAKALGKTVSDTCQLLREMIEKNYLGSEAYIDYDSKSLILKKGAQETGERFRSTGDFHLDFDFSDISSAAGEIAGVAGEIARNFKESFQQRYRSATTQHTQENMRPEPQPEPVREPEPESAPESQPESDLSPEHLSTLAQLKLLNDQIDDRDVSEKIDRISELTKDIYAFVEFNPDRANEVRKFMNYYLPTTLKLLSSYRMLEKQSYQGENIVASRHSIENILDTLVKAFEKQLDQLFAADAVDISSDIQVLETMIAKDGLAQQAMRLHL